MIEIIFPQDWTWFQMLRWLTERVRWCDGHVKTMKDHAVWVTSVWSFDA